MSVFLSFTVLGIVLGAIYGILATGLVVTYKTTGVFNFAQGAVGMVAAFSYWQLWQDWHWPFLLAIVVVVFVEAPLLAIVVEFVLFRRIHGATVERSLMVTLGLLVILLGVATIFWSSPDVIRSVPSYFTQSDGTVLSVHLFGANGVTIQYQQIMFVVIAVVVSLGLGLFLRRVRLGVAMRAVVDDPELVAMAGAKPYRMSQAGWVLGFMLAALAGVLLAPVIGQTGLTADQLTLLALNGFAAAVVGRLRSLPMTFVGAIALGLITQYCVGYLPGHINAGLASVLTEVIPVAFLFLALLVIPAARLAPAGRLAVRAGAQGGDGPPVGGRRHPPRRRLGRGGLHGGGHRAVDADPGAGLRHRGALAGPARRLRRPGLAVPAHLHGYRRLHHGQGPSAVTRGGASSWPWSSRARSARWWRCPPCACAASTWPWPPSPSAR